MSEMEIEYDVKEILKKDGIEMQDLGNGESIEVTSLDKLMEENGKYSSWAKRIIDTSSSGFFQIGTMVSQAKGSGCRKHSHPDCDEVWVIMRGSFQCLVGDNVYDVKQGDVVFTKKGTTHQITVTSDEPGIRLSIAVDNQKNYYNV
jgi:mannose-6-phosphate isomerase-like protein (cupin superfamily)